MNFPDLLVVSGQYQFKPELPFTPGCEFSGTISALGAGLDPQAGWRVGQRVAVMGTTGGFATRAVVPASQVVALPADFDLQDGAAFLFTYGTAWHALMDRANLKAQESVFILGAAGGVGTAALQIAKAAQARVIAGVSTAEKAQACLDMGADDVVVYGQHSIKDRLKQITGGRGVDVVVDPVGGPYAEASFRSMAWRGRYLVVGFAQGTIPALALNLPLLKGASLMGVFWGDFVRREPGTFQRDLSSLFSLYQRCELRPVIDSRRPMHELMAAYERMSQRQVVGKLLLVNESH